MRFSLVGELVLNGGHDEDKILSVEEYFDADDLEKAIMIARAMTQSQKLRQEKHGNDVSELSSVLKNDIGQAVWITNLVPETYKEVIETAEHFFEEIVSN